MNEIPRDFEMEEDGEVIVSPERFANAGEVKDACNAMVQADRRRIPWRAAIDGNFDGNPVYRLSSLEAKGQKWRARCNYLGMQGLINARQTPFFDLVTEVDPCIEVCLDYGKGTDQQDWANAIARNFHLMLMKRWRANYNFHIPVQQLEMLKHGIGYHIWPGNKNRWTPDTPLTGMVLFPDGVSLNIQERLDYFMLRDFLPGYALYDYIRNEDAATKVGWNVDSTWEALAQCSKNQRRGGGSNTWNVEMAQREYKSGDIGTTTSRQAGLWLNHLFVKEIETGKISQYTVAEGVSVSGKHSTKSSDPWSDCLFRKRNRFDEWPLVMFPFDCGSGGLLHTVRGLGARTKDFFELNNRLTNAMADQVLVGSTMNLKQTGNVDPDKLKLMRLGMMSIIPQGLDAVTGLQFPPLAQGPLALLDHLQTTLRENNESYMPGTPEPVDRETAQSFSMRSQNQGQVSKGVHSLYGSNYQQLLAKMFSIASKKEATMGNSQSAKLAKEFHDRCAKDGVPPDALQNVYEINEVLSTGAGSAAARIDALMTIFRLIYPTTTEQRKINIERDLTATLVSSSKVDRYARSHEDNNLPDEDASLAVVENNGLSSGGDALVSSQQDHVEHLTYHEQKAQEIVQAVMSGQMDPEQGLAVIQKFGAHMADHLKFLQQNPMRKAEFDAFYKQWVALSVIADKLTQQIAASQAAKPQRPPQEQISDERAVGLAKVGVQREIGMAKVASQGRIDLSKLAIDSRIKAAQLAMQPREKAAA